MRRKAKVRSLLRAKAHFREAIVPSPQVTQSTAWRRVADSQTAYRAAQPARSHQPSKIRLRHRPQHIRRRYARSAPRGPGPMIAAASQAHIRLQKVREVPKKELRAAYPP